MDSPITRAEHEEFARRIDAEEQRQNHRLTNLENDVSAFGRIASSVETLATNMTHMVKEQERQGKRLDVLEAKPGDNWNTLIKAIVTSIGSAVAGALIAVIAMTLK